MAAMKVNLTKCMHVIMLQGDTNLNSIALEVFAVIITLHGHACMYARNVWYQ